MRMAGAYIFGMQEDVYEVEYYSNLHLNSIFALSYCSSSRMTDDVDDWKFCAGMNFGVGECGILSLDYIGMIRTCLCMIDVD